MGESETIRILLSPISCAPLRIACSLARVKIAHLYKSLHLRARVSCPHRRDEGVPPLFRGACVTPGINRYTSAMAFWLTSICQHTGHRMIRIVLILILTAWLSACTLPAPPQPTTPRPTAPVILEITPAPTLDVDATRPHMLHYSFPHRNRPGCTLFSQAIH